MSNQSSKQKIAIVTSILDTWGGSEELWSQSIPFFQKNGFETILLKYNIDMTHPHFVALKANGTQLVELEPMAPKGFLRKILQKWNKLKRHVYAKKKEKYPFQEKMEIIRPTFVIISQGTNFDGLGYGNICYELNIPYVIICHKAVDFLWPYYKYRPYMTASIQHAAKCFFVSQHNKKLTEEQFGIALSNSEVIYNPIKFGKTIYPYPDSKNGYKLACVARFVLMDKGQDILVRILSKPKWKMRPIIVSFFGEGEDLEGVRGMAQFLQVDNIRFCGQTEDIYKVWETHHALILPSRSEGMPLSVIEAMVMGRTVIVTNAGGNAEIVEHGETGFVGQTNQDGFETAMELAWNLKGEWETMGKKALKSISKKIPRNPEMEFSDKIIKLIHAN